MKKISKLIILFAVMAVSFQSCIKDDDLIKYPDFIETALPYFEMNLDKDDVVNLADMSSTDAEFSFDLQEGADLVQSVDIMVSYNGSDGVLYKNVTTWPSTIAVTGSDLLSAFDASVMTAENLVVGDEFMFYADVKLKDGSVHKGVTPDGNIAFSQDFIGQTHMPRSYNVVYRVNCPSDLAGTYNMTAEGEGNWGLGDPQPWSTTRTVTLTAVGGGVYECDAVLGGIMVDWYAAFGATDNIGQWVTVCGSIQPVAINDGWNNAAAFSGSVDDATGIITYEWANPWGDNAVFTLTPTGK